MRFIYIGIWGITGLIALLSETGILPVEYLAHDANTDYTVSLISIFTAIGGTYLALRLMAFKKIIQKIAEKSTEESAWRVFRKYAIIRLGIIALGMWINTALYYATSYSESIKYCLLIIMIAAVFCWPSAGEFQSKRQNIKK